MVLSTPEHGEKDLCQKREATGPETNRGIFLDGVAQKAGRLGGQEVIWAPGLRGPPFRDL